MPEDRKDSGGGAPKRPIVAIADLPKGCPERRAREEALSKAVKRASNTRRVAPAS